MTRSKQIQGLTNILLRYFFCSFRRISNYTIETEYRFLNIVTKFDFLHLIQYLTEEILHEYNGGKNILSFHVHAVTSVNYFQFQCQCILEGKKYTVISLISLSVRVYKSIDRWKRLMPHSDIWKI